MHIAQSQAVVSEEDLEEKDQIDNILYIIFDDEQDEADV